MASGFIEFSGTFSMIFEFIEEFVSGELSVFFTFTRHKATGAAAIGEGSVEISGSLRKGHCCVCCGFWLRLSGWN
jgi:hypothetical protein